MPVFDGAGTTDPVLKSMELLPLTSFSVLMGRCKGLLHDAVRGARTLEIICRTATQYSPASYRLIIPCGGCMFNEKEMRSRMRRR